MSQQGFGHPEDYEDLLGSERSGGLDQVVSQGPGSANTGRMGNMDGNAPVGAKPQPAPSSWTPGAAKKVPTSVGANGSNGHGLA